MNLRIFIIFLIVFCILGFSIGYISLYPKHASNTTINNTLPIVNNSVIFNTTDTNTSTDQSSTNITDPIVPTSEYVITNINWSNYPLLEHEYINDCELQGPNEVINHSFLHVTIHVDVKDTSNNYEVLKQMAGIVREERDLIGPNSYPNVWGFVEGGRYYHADLMPYENEVYAWSSYGNNEEYIF